jgi:hypothetical protein
MLAAALVVPAARTRAHGGGVGDIYTLTLGAARRARIPSESAAVTELLRQALRRWREELERERGGKP